MDRKNIHSPEKLYAIFERELRINTSILFKEIFEQEPFKGYLFDEFCEAELKPCFWLYRERIYSDEDLERGLKGAYSKGDMTQPLTEIEIFNNRIDFQTSWSQIESAFYTEIAKKILDKTFYCPDIDKTPTALKLAHIEKAYVIFKDKDFDYEKTDRYLEIITETLKSFSRDDLRSKIIERLSNDELNVVVVLANDNGTSYKNWERRKLEFNHLIQQLALPQTQQTDTKHKLSLRQIALKTFYEGGKISRGEGKAYQYFSEYSSLANRKAGKDLTKKKLRNKIELFESVIELLDNQHKTQALDELAILKNYENELY